MTSGRFSGLEGFAFFFGRFRGSRLRKSWRVRSVSEASGVYSEEFFEVQKRFGVQGLRVTVLWV